MRASARSAARSSSQHARARRCRRAAAWSGWSSGAPQKAMTASPMYLSSVPPFEDDVGHRREVLVEEGDQRLGVERLGDRGEAADVGEEDGQLPLLAAQLERSGWRSISSTTAPGDVVLEGLADPPRPFLLGGHADAQGEDEGERPRARARRPAGASP